MIVCDADNVTESSGRPSQEAIQEEWRRQTEALKDVRRRLREFAGHRVRALVRPNA